MLQHHEDGSHLRGRINHATTHYDSAGRPLWMVAVDLEKGGREDIVLSDVSVARRLGLDSQHSTFRRVTSLPVEFDTRDAAGSIAAVGMRRTFDLPPEILKISATDFGLIPALVRNEARMALIAAKTMADSARVNFPALSRNIDADFNCWKTSRNGNSPERERSDMMRAFRSILELSTQALRSTDRPPAPDDRQFLEKAKSLSMRSLSMLSTARHEAENMMNDVTRSDAVGRLMKDFPEVAVQSAAMMAWAAYFTIKNDNPDGIFNSSMSALKAALTRAYMKGTDTTAEISTALESAWRTLIYVRKYNERDQIRYDEVNVAIKNVEAAFNWIGREAPSLERDYGNKVAGMQFSMGNVENRVRRVLEYQTERGLRLTNADWEPDSKGGFTNAFSNGETIRITKDREIIVYDSNSKISILSTPGNTLQHFVNGRKLDEGELGPLIMSHRDVGAHHRAVGLN